MANPTLPRLWTFASLWRFFNDFFWTYQLSETLPARSVITLEGDIGTSVHSPLKVAVLPEQLSLSVGPWHGQEAVGRHVFTASCPGFHTETVNFQIRADQLMPPPPPPREWPPFNPQFKVAEEYPDVAFISTATVNANDPFLRFARAYHERWGIPLVQVETLDEIIASIAAGSTSPTRMRIICHGDPNGLFMAMFPGGDPKSSITRLLLSAFGRSIIEGLGATVGEHIDLDTQISIRVEEQVREILTLRRYVLRSVAATNRQVFEPFGLTDELSQPTPLVDQLLTRGVELGALRNRLAAIGANHRDRPSLAAAEGGITALTELLARELEQGGQGTAELAQQLSRIVAQLVRTTSIGSIKTVCPRPEQAAYVSNIEAAVKAVQGSFAADMVTARGRLATTYLDVRACRAGEEGLLRALGEFFGINPKHVNGPRWRSGFGIAASVETYDDNPEGRQSLAQEGPVRKELQRWSRQHGVAEWWNTHRPQRVPDWDRRSHAERLRSWLSQALFLVVRGSFDTPSRVIFHRREGGLPPEQRPEPAIERFLRNQWARAPEDRVIAIRDEILNGKPVPIAVVANQEGRAWQLYVLPDLDYTDKFITG